MFVFSFLCLAIASSYHWVEIFGAEYNDEDSIFAMDDQSRVSELGSTREEHLNCFLQFDQFLADKWTSQLDLGANSNPAESTFIINRQKQDEEISETQQLTVDIRTTLDGLGTCMGNLTKSLKSPGLKKCMKDLVNSEIENDGFISLPELFDNSLPLPFLTFLDIRELSKVLYQNRSWEELSKEETTVFQKAREYMRKDRSFRDKVFVLDQTCEWKNLAGLKNREEDIDEKLREFKQQVIRLISLNVARGIFSGGDLKPGTWISLYRRWVPVRLQNLRDLDSSLGDLKKQRFTTEDLCGYASTLGIFFSQLELKVLLPEKLSPLHITTGDIKAKSKSKEARLCDEKSTKECETFRRLKKTYEEDLKCVETFGELLSNHILYSIIQIYANVEPRITYPEILCKKDSPKGQISIRYCRCVGSFCTFRQVGDINANSYKLTDGVVTKV